MGLQFYLCKDTELLKKLHSLFCGQCGRRLNHGTDVGKPASCSLGNPFIGVAVAVENNPLMLRHVLFDQIVHGKFKVLCFLQNIRRLAERFRNDGIQGRVRAGDRICTAHHAELKFVAGEGKG